MTKFHLNRVMIPNAAKKYDIENLVNLKRVKKL